MTTQATDQHVYQQVQSVIRRWRDGAPPDARGAMAQIPGLHGYPSLMIDLAYEQYCLEEAAGAIPAVSQFCAGFESIASQLRDVLEGHKVLLNNPQLLQVAAWPAPGDRWDAITFVRELGRGAFARAYQVEDASINRRVVLKLSHRDASEGLSLGTLKHPHVVDILWSRAMNGFHVVAMPYEAAVTLLGALDALRPRLGGPLRADALLAAAAAGDLPPEGRPRLLTGAETYADGVAAVAERLADALAHAQRHGISHGDLKPANVLIGPTGNPYLIDFNLASDANRSRAVLGGTLPYMAPERLAAMHQGATQIPATESSDVYSFGVVLFEALTGRLPFGPPGDYETPQAAVAAELETRRRTSLRRPPSLPRRLFAVVRDCLADDAAARPTFRAASDRLNRYRTRRRRAWRAAAALGALALIAAIVVGVLNRKPPPREPQTKAEYLARGHDRLRAGAWDLAILDFSKAMEIEPDGRTAATLSYAYLLAGNDPMATRWSENAVDVFGFREAWALNNYAAALNNQRTLPSAKPTLAIQMTSEVLQAQPRSRAALYNRALAQYRADLDDVTGRLRDPRCLRDIARVLATGPRPRSLCIDAAQMYAAAGPLHHATAAVLATEAGQQGPTIAPVVQHPGLNKTLQGSYGWEAMPLIPRSRWVPKAAYVRYVAPPEQS